MLRINFVVEIKIEGFGGRPPFGGRPGALGPMPP